MRTTSEPRVTQRGGPSGGPELKAAETVRTTEEDFEWAKAQLKR